ncbi:MAG: hypothetical protein ACOCU8_01285 [Patescibacteria group bacterium]
MGFENFWTSKRDSDKRLQDELKDLEFEQAESEGDEMEKIPFGLIATVDLYEKHAVSFNDIYKWYARAISRRDRAPLEEERFVNHFEGASHDPTFAFGDFEKGYLLGYLKYKVFVPTHFAPRTMKGGYSLIKDLGESENIPAIMSITEDLKKTILKMPSWQALDMNFITQFREELVDKQIVYNSHKDTKNLMLGLLAEYLESANRED